MVSRPYCPGSQLERAAFANQHVNRYLAIITVCASTGVPCPLPVFDLSHKIFAHNKDLADERVGAVKSDSASA